MKLRLLTLGIITMVLILSACGGGNAESETEGSQNTPDEVENEDKDNNKENDDGNKDKENNADEAEQSAAAMNMEEELNNVNEFYKQTKYPSNFKKDGVEESFVIMDFDGEVVYIVKDHRYLVGEEDGISVHSIRSDVATHHTGGTSGIKDDAEFVDFGDDVEEVKDGVFANRQQVRWIDKDDGYFYKFSFGQPEEMVEAYDEMEVQGHGFIALEDFTDGMLIPEIAPEGYKPFFVEYKHTKVLFSDPYRTQLEIVYRNADDKKIHFNVYGGFDDISDAYYSGKTNKTYGDIDVLLTTAKLEFEHNDLVYEIDFRSADEETIEKFIEDLLVN